MYNICKRPVYAVLHVRLAACSFMVFLHIFNSNNDYLYNLHSNIRSCDTKDYHHLPNKSKNALLRLLQWPPPLPTPAPAKSKGYSHSSLLIFLLSM